MNRNRRELLESRMFDLLKHADVLFDQSDHKGALRIYLKLINRLRGYEKYCDVVIWTHFAYLALNRYENAFDILDKHREALP